MTFMTYEIKLKPNFVKQLKKVDNKQAKRILVKIQQLADNPMPLASKQLKGVEARRLRIGDYRVIYKVEDGQLIVLVLAVGHRKDVYR